MPVKQPQKVTITTIAKHLGISHQTVSNVLSGKAEKRKVAESTAVKVQKAADKLGYVPNLWARNLQSKKTGAVSVLFNGLHLDWAERIENSVEGVLERWGYLATISIYGRLPMYASTSNETEKRKIQTILQRRDEGVIIQPSPYTKSGYELLRKWKMPMVFIGSVLSDLAGLEDVSYVIWDCGPAAKKAVQHLINTGRKRIAFVGGKHGVDSDAVRFNAYKQVMNDAGLEVRDQWVVWHQLDKPITSDLLAPLFNNGPDKPDAIFAINDSFAALLIELLLERQISVPDDVSVVGMGDLRITRTCGITTMREPLEDIGREAAEILMELIKNPDHEPLRKKLYCNDLIIRRTA